jgi:hypothetical protein
VTPIFCIQIITSVDVSIRAWLKGEQYSSPLSLISIYEQVDDLPTDDDDGDDDTSS